ncbi:cytochrome P450 [soil metagenome]
MSVVTELHVPDELASAVIRPENYPRLEEVVLPACRRLRDEIPFGIATVEGWDPVWLASRHADITAIAKNQQVFLNGDFPHLPSTATVEFAREVSGSTHRSFDYPSYMDAPEHVAFRTSVMPYFQPAKVREVYEARFRQFAKDSVDALMDHDGEADFVKDFSTYYPLRVVLGMLGLDVDKADLLLKFTIEFFGIHDPANQRPEFRGLPDAAARQYSAAIKDLLEYFSDLRKQRLATPTDDLVTWINSVRIDGEPWPDSHADSFLAGVAPAGHDTTSSTVAGGMLGMLRFPDQFQKVKENPALLSGLVEESLRYTTPAKHFMRVAAQDTEVNGIPVSEGERIMMLFVSGNRDERVFENPDTFDVTRRPNPHLSFSQGPHICTGMHVARLEMRILWEELLGRVKSIELAGDIAYEQSNLVSGLKTLPVRFTKV